MRTPAISDREAFELAQGRVPARPDLDPLADLLADYRSAAIGPAPRPSEALSARLDLSTPSIAMQRTPVVHGRTDGATRRAASGLFGVGVVAAIILGAASGAAAVVGAGSAGLLPPGAQEAFDQVVSVITPLGVAGQDTTDKGEAPGDSTTNPPTAEPTDPGTVTVPAVGGSDATEEAKPDDTEGTGDADKGKTGKDDSGKSNNGNGNDGKANTGGGNDGKTNTGGGNDGKSNNGKTNNGNGNDGKSDSGTGDPGKSNNGNGNNGNGNNGNGNNGNGNNGNGNDGKSDKSDKGKHD